MITDPFVLSLLAILVLVFVLRRTWGRQGRRTKISGPPPNAIVVDGSNVMHWGGEPSAKTLARVLQDLTDKGLTPIAYFDANVGYKLGDSYMDAAQLGCLIGLPSNQICVVNKGVIADQVLLAFAADHGLRVVSNDRYREWRTHFPHLQRKGSMLRGSYTNGSVLWRESL